MWGRAGPGSAWTSLGNIRQAEPSPHPDFRSDTTNTSLTVTECYRRQQQLESNLTWPMSAIHDAIKDSLWNTITKWCFIFDTVCILNLQHQFVWYLSSYLRKKDSGGKVLVVQERNRTNVFHQVGFFCLQVHKTCGGKTANLWGKHPFADQK